LRTTRFHILLTRLPNFASIFRPIFEREKTEGGSFLARDGFSSRRTPLKERDFSFDGRVDLAEFNDTVLYPSERLGSWFWVE
jgi:hypothetical protein